MAKAMAAEVRSKLMLNTECRMLKWERTRGSAPGQVRVGQKRSYIKQLSLFRARRSPAAPPTVPGTFRRKVAGTFRGKSASRDATGWRAQTHVRVVAKP